MRELHDREPSRLRWWRVPVFGILSFALLFTWIDRSDITTIELGTPSRIIVVSSAGPVRVTQGAISEVTHRDSWVFGRPIVEIEGQGSDILVRVVCEGWAPCRSSIDLQVTGTPELLVMAEGFVDIDRFDGKLTVFSGNNGVALGPVSGSVRVVSGDSVTGAGLETSLLDVSTDGDINLWFGDVREEYRVQILDSEGAERRVDNGDVSVSIATNGEAERSVALKTDGEVHIFQRPDSEER